MKPSIIFFISIVYLSQASSGLTNPSSPKTFPQETNILNWNLAPTGELENEFTADESIYLAYLDTFYYRIDRWIPVFKKRIAFLESAPPDVETQLALMKYYYGLGGLNVELSHIMGFDSNYKIREIEDDSLLNIRQAKWIAQEILSRKGLTPKQKAQAYLYLGAAEGALGYLEFREGNIMRALNNGFQADNHLEKSLLLDPNRMDAHLGLGIYRYGNSRLGGLGNLILQAGRDQRQVGLSHIERAIRAGGISTPLAIKTLGWVYINVQINPDNAHLPEVHPLSPLVGRAKVHTIIETMENRYYKNPPAQSFIGNKEFTMMKAIQFVLDGEYAKARIQFEKILRIIDFLRKAKGYEINPQQEITIREALHFCDVMLLGSMPIAQRISHNDICFEINQEVDFLSHGGRVIEYDVEKIRDELNAVFYQRLVSFSHFHCEHGDLHF